MNTNYTITTNEQYKSLEISFTEKPGEAIRTALKSLNFRWNPKKSIWYGFASVEEVTAALGTENAPQTKPSKADQNHIRVYYNGLKVDGGDLVRCFYFKDGDKINITARDYDRLPSDLFEVHNDTDLYTDYFCEDSATLTPDHPLYKYVFYAYKKSAAKASQRHIDYINKRIAKGVKFDFYKDDLERANKSIEEFKSMTDPGQPTAADLAEIDRANQIKENERIAKEHEEELARREQELIKRCEGSRLVEQYKEKYPLVEGEVSVMINWSEHSAFFNYGDNELILSLAAAENILHALDLQESERPGYDKTKFTIFYTDESGEPSTYTGRYDLGDNDGGLISHIRRFGEYHLTHDKYGHDVDTPEETNDIIEFANFLEGEYKKAC